MSGMFDPDNKVFSFLNTLANLIITNFFCILLCLPVITAGASITAMYYVTLGMSDNREPYVVKGFFRAFRSNFRQATQVWIGFLLVALFIYFDINLIVTGFDTSLLSSALQITLGVIAAFVLITFVYAFPMLARFENSIKHLLMNSFVTAVRHFPFTLLILIIYAFPFALLILNAQYGIFINAFFGFSLAAYANSFLFTRIFKKYIPETAENGTLQ